MVDKLSITIALNGGKQIEQQLADIGEAGKKAFGDILTAAEKAGGLDKIKPEELAQKFKDLGVTGEDSINKITAAVQKAVGLERLVNVVQSVEKGFTDLGSAAALVGQALGPIGVVAGVALAKVVSMAIEAAGAINKIDAAAIQAGMSIEKFDKISQALRQTGISAGAAAEGMGKIAAAVEKGKLDEVTKAFNELQAASARGFGGVGTSQLETLEKAAAGVGPAADAARAALEKLGKPVPEGTVKSLSELITQTGSAGAGLEAFGKQLDGMKNSADRNALALDQLGPKMGTEMVQRMNAGGSAADFAKERFDVLSQSMANTATSMEQSLNKSAAAWERFKATGDVGQLGTIWTELANRVGIALTQMGNEFDAIKGKVGEFVSSLSGDIWSAFASAGSAAIDAVKGSLDSLITKLKEVESLLNKITGGGGGGGGSGEPMPGMAGGGMIGGRGSGTSDSNLAWVSRGEHIMPAHAVSQPGVLAFLEALRRSGGNLRGAMGGFALGGVVPRFAAGGLVGGMGHLGTVDLRTNFGSATVMASSSAVDQLSRLAVTKRMTSTGRKPGFIG